MPAPNELPSSPDPVKIIFMGKTGNGKSVSKAPLIAAGYKLYCVDIDKGTKGLRSWLTDREHFPYGDYCLKHNIDISASSIVPIDQDVRLTKIKKEIKDPNSGRVLRSTDEYGLAPMNSRGWIDTISLLDNWKDGERNLGNIYSWGPDVVLDIDTWSKLSRYAYYWVQGMNNRLGALEEGFDHQRDNGAGQSQLRRLLETLFSSHVKCNVIINCHISWIDESRGFAQSPQERARQNQSTNPDGLPESLGIALSPKMGTFFNDVYYIKDYRIYTTTTDKVICKRSLWLEDSYDNTTGLAEIFFRHQNKELPRDFIASLGHKPSSAPAASPNGTERLGAVASSRQIPKLPTI